MAGGPFSGLVGGAYGRCSTATNPTTPSTDFSYTLQSAADLGAAAHGPIKKWGRFGGFRATARATATWAPRVFSRLSGKKLLRAFVLSQHANSEVS